MNCADWKPEAVAEYLRRTGRLDVDWYVATMGLGDGAGEREALEHFLAHGACRGRGPNRELDLRGDRAAGRHGVEAAVPPAGGHEALARLLDSTGMFDAATYHAANPDVEAAGLDPLLHFATYGWKELRNPSNRFDVWWYWSTYLDPTSDAVNP